MMDVGVNKPFKDRVKTNFDDWLVEEIGEDCDANPKPLRENVARWIVDSWNDIGMEIIKNSWQHAMGNIVPEDDMPVDDDSDDFDFLDLHCG